MSLSYQINLRILLSSLLILILGGFFAIWQARNSVNKEINSSVSLTTHLISCSLSQPMLTQHAWLNCFNSFENTRHLTIELIKPSGETIRFGSKDVGRGAENSPPGWFVNLIGSQKTAIEKPITTSLGDQFSLRIQANPLDEINEAWSESITFLSSFLALTILVLLSVYFALNKTVYPIRAIVDALKKIETGDYQEKIDDFDTAEYNSIARAVNHMTDELNKSQQENRALIQHSLEALEEERKKLAQELHDEFAQSLTAIKIMAHTANHQKEKIKEMTETISNICDGLIESVRSIMYQLHPRVLTELGLKAALEDLLQHWSSKHTDMKFDLRCDDEVDSLNRTLIIQIYRVVQEGLTNIIRHSEANACWVKLEIDNSPTHQIKLLMKDNGKGCHPEKLTKGFGILGMKERVRSLGGIISIQSELNKGVEIKVSMPILEYI